MADLADVENVLVAAIAQVIYPGGTAQSSLTGAPVIVYRGWPIPKNLDNDLAAGTVNISVFAQPNERNVTRFPREWQVRTQPVFNLTLTVAGQTVTLAGTPSSPLNAAVATSGTTYLYAVQPTDTLATIATALAMLINQNTPATSSGPVITIPAAANLTAIVGGVGSMIREIRRQKRGFIITLWCADPDSRDALAGPLDEALAGIDYLILPDGSAARLIYEKTLVSDRSERENLYRRDLFYSVEYATTNTQAAYQIVDIVLNLEDSAGNPLPAPVTISNLPPTGSNALLLETGAYMLLENGGRLVLDIAPQVTHQDSLQLETGGYLLGETGGRLLVSAPAAHNLLLETGGHLLAETGGNLLT